jgi:protein involved in polysaccharide export with SLBB domain
MRCLVVALGLCLSAAPRIALAQSPAPAADGTNGALNPGDVVRITVWRKPELSGDFIIAGDGSVSHPLYRDVRVTGMPLAAVRHGSVNFSGSSSRTPSS